MAKLISKVGAAEQAAGWRGPAPVTIDSERVQHVVCTALDREVIRTDPEDDTTGQVEQLAQELLWTASRFKIIARSILT